MPDPSFGLPRRYRSTRRGSGRMGEWMNEPAQHPPEARRILTAPPPAGAARSVAVRVAVALTAALLAFGGCGPGEPRRPPARHVILISIDTLRADHLGCYGYPAPVSPSIDRFRGDAVLVRHTIAQAPSTLSSHASLFTSLLPRHHGASFAAGTALPASMTTLAEVLREQGFATAAFHNAGQLRAGLGLGQGFELYRRVRRNRFATVVERALQWLDRLGDRPFFLFLHTYEVHHPYEPQPRYLQALDADYAGPLPAQIPLQLLQRINRGEIPFDARDLDHVVAAYDAEIRSMDEAFGRLVAELRQRGLYDRALIVLTSDHGEEFGEHGRVGWHSHTLYDELLKVPLLIKLPAGDGAGGGKGEAAGATVEAQVRLIDVAPTVLEGAGVPIPEVFAGESLLPLLDPAGPSHRPAVSQIDTPRGVPASVSIRTRRWKLWDRRLFDLEQDPEETFDVSILHPERVLSLREALEHALTQCPATAGRKILLDEETERELRALGYLD